MGALIDGEMLDGVRQLDGTFRLKVDAVTVPTLMSAAIGCVVTLSEITSASSPVIIPEGATEISLANIGSANAKIQTANMSAPENLYPTSSGGMAVTWRAPDGKVLPAVTITTPVGAIVKTSVIV